MTNTKRNCPPRTTHTALAAHALGLARVGLDNAEQAALVEADRCRSAGMTAAEIADVLGWSRSTLFRRMKDAGIW